ncbi:XP_028607023.1LOW QUALITY PROTEIN: uncharacterized protein LOC114607758 [Podarcis lilfordi]|uniref:XP_028607023.1LOW QUALITY PROTEIN: uncharacterized protein LOC114607758 n=1 Tax=Podarcis lilfordi TaxID=74358 RepID=A0AA35JSU7_9SAUR|nr:XP_028607023.1LOW QUALITY PROTEIN: uncharacterized protein LOC114607758 [Podarcis lilfordi]
MRRAARKPTNLAKVAEVVQKSDESPGVYLERLKEAYRQFTPLDPDDPANAPVVKAAFVAQATPDIRRKIPKRDGFRGHGLEWMLEVAQTTYNQRDEVAQKKKENYQAKKLMALRASNSGTGEPARGEGAAAWDATSAPSAAKRATGRTNALREELEAGEAGFLAPSPWEMALT